MEIQINETINNKKKRGRPPKYSTEEERKRAIQKSKNKHITNKEWICNCCGGHNYTMACKWRHLRTKKHLKNSQSIN